MIPSIQASNPSSAALSGALIQEDRLDLRKALISAVQLNSEEARREVQLLALRLGDATSYYLKSGMKSVVKEIENLVDQGDVQQGIELTSDFVRLLGDFANLSDQRYNYASSAVDYELSALIALPDDVEYGETGLTVGERASQLFPMVRRNA